MLFQRNVYGHAVSARAAVGSTVVVSAGAEPRGGGSQATETLTSALWWQQHLSQSALVLYILINTHDCGRGERTLVFEHAHADAMPWHVTWRLHGPTALTHPLPGPTGNLAPPTLTSQGCCPSCTDYCHGLSYVIICAHCWGRSVTVRLSSLQPFSRFLMSCKPHCDSWENGSSLQSNKPRTH